MRIFRAVSSGMITLSLLLILSSSSAHSDPKDFYFKRYLEEKAASSDDLPLVDGNRNEGLLASRPDGAQVLQGFFDQRINHADANDPRTFKQRYYIDRSYAEGPNAPVLLAICGESTCRKSVFRGAIA